MLEPATSTALFVKICIGDLEKLSTSIGGSSKPRNTVLDNADVEVVMSAYNGKHPEHLLNLLKTILEQRRKGGKKFSPLLSEALLELCLGQYAVAKQSFDEALTLVSEHDRSYPRKWPEPTRKLKEKLEDEEKTVMSVLDGSHSDTYDISQALLLAHDNNCEAAQRFFGAIRSR